MKKNLLIPALILWALPFSFLHAQMPGYLYEEWRKSAYPDKDIEIKLNPSPLLWASTKYWDKKEVTYNVYLSQDPAFPPNATFCSKGQRYCFFNPHQPLKAGKWFWRYEIVENGKAMPQPVCSFNVSASAEHFSTPTTDEFRAHIPATHPRVMNYGRPMQELRHQASKHPLYAHLVKTAQEAVAKAPYRGAVTDKDPARARRLTQKANKEVELYRTLLEGYTLSANKNMQKALLERTDILLAWPTDDLLGSKVLTALALGYDMLYDELPTNTKARMLSVIDKQLKEGLARWPGYVEARQVENHFWQMEIAGNFTAAVAVLGDLESAREMLDYTYELFIARFPNLATQDGGWNEGEGYYSVNQTAIVDMALLLKKIGGIDIFCMPWYRNLTDYFTYFSPVAAPVSGFGDMHERVESGSLKGRSEMLTLGCEEKNAQALFRLFQSLRPIDTFYDASLPENYWKKPLAKLEPWYQIANDLHVTPRMAQAPQAASTDKVFYGVGLAAIHTDVLSPDRDATVFFRSSPFGSKGHAHADQNSFNISRRGERLFYSTGYYTSFADLHSLTSYKHTRASNSILINGYGQAFGHEGYGWIKRNLTGENLSYVCGDASHAYKRTTDKQFADFMAKCGIEQNHKYGMGDTPMKKFERHLIFARPDVVVIYDVLEADEPSQWSLLLHSRSAPAFTAKKLALNIETMRSQASAQVFGSAPVRAEVTDRFFSPAVDFKKKFPNGTPNQYHATFSTTGKVKQMRYLTIICLGDANGKLPTVKSNGKGKWKVGQVAIKAEMNTHLPASATISYGNEVLSIRPDRSTLTGNGKTNTCTDLKPQGNYAY